MTTRNPIKDQARRFIAALDAQDWASVMEQVAPDCRSHVGGQTLDREGWKGMGQMFYAGFPDGAHEVVDLIAEDDRVAVRGRFEGTHTGDFQGIPPTGRRVALDMVLVYRFAGGRVAEHWGYFDGASLMAQLGLLPAQH
jgi:steroid delta-isomerase-like uncharacterized protein